MSKMIFVNLPVTDLARSITFYEAAGAVRDDRFADETAQCMTFSDSIHVMLLTHEKFSTFTNRSIVDARTSAEVLLALSQDSRAAVNAMVDAALAAGGSEVHEPQDHGFMFERAVADPDGHGWGVMWMDMAAFEKMNAGQKAEADA
ncbi:lactoylglutathione lyase [Sphingobium sp. SCG-1]|uniref:VOC family protein n=1 Tax=Sphingobium sp. SCG-1 TaxID=2072936 RepID=UPI000CD6ADD8|nr:VOC family protein [Sphingobium sp. SCG-1]AUW59386.1 lactoylglutathione lyase [Sphingobium sp. SCG-1]